MERGPPARCSARPLPPPPKWGSAGSIRGSRRTTGTVTVKPAVYGDADLNGAVGSSDLSIVLSNFGKAGVWATGDFDYNDTVGSSDLSIVLANFGQTLPATFNVASYTNLDAAAINMLNAAGIKTVPEPGTIALLAAGLLGLLAYAWRKRK